MPDADPYEIAAETDIVADADLSYNLRCDALYWRDTGWSRYTSITISTVNTIISPKSAQAVPWTLRHWSWWHNRHMLLWLRYCWRWPTCDILIVTSSFRLPSKTSNSKQQLGGKRQGPINAYRKEQLKMWTSHFRKQALGKWRESSGKAAGKQREKTRGICG